VEECIVAAQSRDRVSVDLRGVGVRLHAFAESRRLPAAALVRTAVLAMLEAEQGAASPGTALEPFDRRVVKVTLRLDAGHARLLTARARSACVSQGTYVVGLLDGIPASPRSADHGSAVSALAHSTQRVAAMSSDLHRFIRLLNLGSSSGVENYRAGLMSLSDDVRQHLQLASRLMASLTAKGQGRAGSLHGTETRK
jgi:hypothetical protein